MIEAVVGVVDDDTPPPPELVLAWKVEQWGTLPEAGGLYDQDDGLLHTMTVLSNIYKTVSAFRSMHGEEIHKLTDSQRKIIRELRDIGVI